MTLCAPAVAQSDFTGKYRKLSHSDAAKRGSGPEIGDYTGLPLNDAARMRADSWEASLFTIPEYQCRPHTGPYSERGFSGTNIKWWAEIDPRTQTIVAWRTRAGFEEPERWIYMDGRPHPPDYAAHTWLGFSTGKWEGSTLVVKTTHLKEGYTERNGVAQSDRTVVTENWVRHGDYLNEITIIEDPVYLTEPLVTIIDLDLRRFAAVLSQSLRPAGGHRRSAANGHTASAHFARHEQGFGGVPGYIRHPL